MLDLIAERPAVRAPDLAASLGLDTVTFKRDVRKLKELGLTESLTVGYRISPRGIRVADSFGASGSPGPEQRQENQSGLDRAAEQVEGAGHAAVCGDGLARDESGRVGCEEHDDVGDVLGL